MQNKKLILISALVAVLVLSGCAKKETQKPVAKNTNAQQVNTNVNENQGAGAVEDGQSGEEIDRQTYRNEEYGFEFKYPKNWYIDNTRSTPNEIVFEMEEIPGREAVKFSKNTNNLTYEELKEQKTEFYKLVTLNTSDLIVDGEKALKIKTSEFGTIRIYFMHNEFIYEITTGGRMEEGVLDSFKFIF